MNCSRLCSHLAVVCVFALGSLVAGPARAQVEPFRVIASPDTSFLEGFGAWVVAIGDADDDGLADLIVSAPLADGQSLNEGKVYLVFSSGAVEDTVLTPHPQRDGGFGAAAAFVGDLNGDFRREAVIGAPGERFVPGSVFESGGAGRAYVAAGGSGDILYDLVSPNPDTTGNFGNSVAGPGDLTGDGIPDFVVAARYESSVAPYAGNVYIYSGADGSLVRTLVSPTAIEDGTFGWRVEPVSDLDADGVPDLLVSALRERPEPGSSQLGRVHVFSGATGEWVRAFDSGVEDSLPTMDGALADVGDIDGDGIADVAVGGTTVGENGVVYLFSGATRALIRLIDPVLEGAVASGFGAAIAPIGDVDADGVPDLFVGAPFENTSDDPDETDRSGAAHVISGATGEDLLKLNSSYPRLNGRFGFAIAWADIDGDGQNDPVVGAPFERLIPENPTGGLVYLYTQAALREAIGPPPTGQEPEAIADDRMTLGSPAPHPVVGQSTLAFTLAAPGVARLTLYDVLGREVALLAEGTFSAGRHEVTLDAARLRAGVYVARLRTGSETTSRRVVVVR